MTRDLEAAARVQRALLPAGSMKLTVGVPKYARPLPTVRDGRDAMTKDSVLHGHGSTGKRRNFLGNYL